MPTEELDRQAKIAQLSAHLAQLDTELGPIGPKKQRLPRRGPIGSRKRKTRRSDPLDLIDTQDVAVTISAV